MQIKIKALILSSLLLIAVALLSGAYLSYQPVHLSQPDDSKLELYASGDEYYNWLHDKEGYTVKQNDKGWYVYLTANANKELVFTDYIVGQVEPATVDLIPWANITTEKMGQIRQKAQKQLKEIGSGRAPSSGILNNISIFIRFSDQTEFGQDISTYSSMFNGTTGNTMQSYFKEASYSTLDITTTFYPTPSTTVVSWQDSHPRAYYSPYNETTNPTGYNGDTERTDREFTLLVNAVNGVSSSIPTTPSIDGDGDGMVDNVCFIIKGGSDGWAELLWPHRWSIYDRYVYINGKRVYDFNFQLADFMASSGVGVLCHEMFHSLGAPDLYHYTSNGMSQVGSWDIMESNTNPPQHMGAYMKYKYGHWISSIPTISTSGTYTLNPLTSSTGQCYRINSPNSSSEYFVVEFRKKTGTFENSLPNSGMLIYRINPAYDGNADGPPDEVYLFRPGGTPSANGTVTSANFSSETGRTSFNNTTNPYGFLTNGTTLGGISLSSISSSAGSTMTFQYNLSNTPLNLTAETSGGTVSLAWQAPQSGIPTSYKIYRGGVLKGTSTVLSYTDSAVTVGQTYSYYVKAMFTTESPASNTVSITVSSLITVIIGTGTDSSSTTAASPINVYYKSLHGQAVYTKAELNDLGVVGPINISQLGFNITGLPTVAMPNFVVRMKHTTAVDVASWQTSTDMTTVYANTSYLPTATGWNLYTLNTPFLWNGIDNIVIDTAYGLIGSYTSTGTVQFSTVTSGYRYGRSDTVDQTSVFSGGSTSTYRPNLKLSSLPNATGPLIAANPSSLTYGDVAVGSNSVQQFTIQNFGDQTLTGTITTPVAYNVALSEARSDQQNIVSDNDSRNLISFSVGANASKIYNVTFAPSVVSAYNGNVVISSNAVNSATVNIAVTGAGYIPPTIAVDVTELTATLMTDEESSDTFSISNTGSQPLTYSIGIAEVHRRGTVIPAAVIKESTGKSIAGSTLVVNVAQYSPGTTENWTFTVTNASTDTEWMKDIYLTFPTGITVNSSSSFVGGSGDMTSDNATGNGAVIHWNGVSGSWGVIHGGETATATVNVTIAAGLSAPLTLAYQLNGDIYGAEPHVLNDVITLPASIPPVQWFSASPLNGTIAAGANQTITGNFSAVGMETGMYEALLSINSNDPIHPLKTVQILMEVTPSNHAPTINLPASFEFNSNSSLVESFSPYVSDEDNDSLTLGCSGNTNILVNIDGLTVTFTVAENWHGSEVLTFSVFDGYAYAYDTVTVTVNLSYLAVPDVAVAKSSGGITISWNAVTNANCYYIYRATEPYGNYGSEPYAVVDAPTTLWEDTQALPKAFYHVKAAFAEQPAKE